MKKVLLTLTLLVTLLAPGHGFAEEYRILTNIIPPLKYEERGVFKGVCVDLLVEIMEAAGAKDVRDSITASSWSRAYKETLDLPGTILVSMAMTPERKDKFKWVGPIYPIQFGLIGKANRGYTISGFDDLDGLVVGTQAATAPEKTLFQRGFPKSNARSVPELKNCLLMLEENRLDLLAHAVEPALFTMHSLGIDRNDYRVYLTYQKVDIYIALNKSFSDEFVADMQKALEAIKQPGPNGLSRYDEIVARYTQQ